MAETDQQGQAQGQPQGQGQHVPQTLTTEQAKPLIPKEIAANRREVAR